MARPYTNTIAYTHTELGDYLRKRFLDLNKTNLSDSEKIHYRLKFISEFDSERVEKLKFKIQCEKNEKTAEQHLIQYRDGFSDTAHERIERCWGARNKQVEYYDHYEPCYQDMSKWKNADRNLWNMHARHFWRYWKKIKNIKNRSKQ